MNRAGMEVLLTSDHDRWMAVLEEALQHDFHHLPSYHRVAEQRGEGIGHLFIHREQGCMIALPLLLRPVDPAESHGWQDATSVYGYGGPVASQEVLPEGVAGNFQAALREVLIARRVIAGFSRMHPLIAHHTALAGLGECREKGETVSINLGVPEEQQLAQYNKSCRRIIRRLRHAGFLGLHDIEKQHLGAFVTIYHETMRRVGARRSYFFDEAYFRLLAQELGATLQLFVVLRAGEVVAASLATICDGIVQDHLGGTLDRFLEHSPDRLLIETERHWATQQGARVLHLGGGVGSQHDSVFQYKTAFSHRRHRFHTWRCVLQAEIYESLCASRARHNTQHGLAVASPDYFPAYRAPTLPVNGRSTGLASHEASASAVTPPPGEGRRPKVAHITTVDVSLVYLLLNQMQSLGHAGFEVCGISAPGEAVSALAAVGIRHLSVAMSRNLTPLADLIALSRLVAVMRRERFDIVHTHTPKAGLLGQLAARLAGVPIVVNTVHGFYFHEHMAPRARRFYIALERIAARCSSLILSQNAEDLQTAVRERICPPERIEFLGNGIDLTQFDPQRFPPQEESACRARLGIAPEAPVVGFVGRLAARRKGFLDFLAAARTIAAQCPEARFLVAGEADRGKPDAVEPSVAEEYGIAERCVFLGHRENAELPLFYRMMQVLVLPSLFEGVPRVVMEASAMGVPAVVSDVKGNREAVEHGRNGLRVPLGDVPALSAAILRILREPETARQMSAEGRRIAAERFDERLVFAKVQAAYARLLREKGRPRPAPRRVERPQTVAPVAVPSRQGGRTAGELRVLSVADDTAWKEVLASVAQHDFHHLPAYHRAAEQSGEGTAQFFVYREGGHVLALPLLLRPVDGAAEGGWRDATSVYGYGGPLASRDPLPESVVRNFQAALREALLARRVVAAFSRLHPLMEPQAGWLAGLGECVPGGRTISIDLTLPAEEQRAQYRDTYKRRLNKLRREGVECVLDTEKQHLDEFIRLYLETMQRVEAHHSYFFDEPYFQRLVRELGPVLHLFVARLGGQIVAGGLITLCDGIVQYHLGGTRDEFLDLSPMALIFDTARLWGMEHGARVLHFGGGVGSKEDGVFNFKAGFSDRRHAFATWRWIVEPQVYRDLCEQRLRANERAALEPVSTAYFPAYRCPTIPRTSL